MRLIAATYERLRRRRAVLTLALLLLLLVGGGLLSRLEVEESIVAMLPDGDSRVASDFKLLQQAPFARKLVIHLRSDESVPADRLHAATDQMRNLLPPDLFNNLLSGPGGINPGRLSAGLIAAMPALLDQNDLQDLGQELTPEKIDRQVATDLAQLLQPQGVALKENIRRDPLDLLRFAMAKLRYLNPLPGVRIEQGHFTSADGHSTLLLADTPVQITDAVAGRELVDAFATARLQLPGGVNADLLSGHPYTLANSEAIQGDMRIVLSVSGIGIFLLFVFFLRRLRALAVYLLPLFSISAALVVTSLWYGRVSGITIGFGAVLLGITIDFGLHVYFALQHGHGQRAYLLQAVSKPVLFGGLTTLAAFSVLLNSELPGQRQLAIFAIAGSISALLLALLVMPHFLGKNDTIARTGSLTNINQIYVRQPKLRRVVILLWFGLALFGAIQTQKFGINGELRQLSYIPKQLQQAENRLAESWGRMRDRAMIFTAAANREEAIAANDQIWQILDQQQLQGEAVSLAPLLAGQKIQKQRLHNWNEFWTKHRAKTEELLQKSGQKYGFSTVAFQPFFDTLERSAQIIEPETLTGWGMNSLLDNLLLKDGNSYRLITLVPDRPELVTRLDAELAKVPGATLVSQGRFGRELSLEVAADFAKFIISAGIAVLLLLIVLFRRLQDVLLALLPVLTGLLVMFGGMSLVGLDMNMFNVIATILIIGLGVDYGIFMVCHSRQQEETASTRAVLVSGLTTLVGFGALVLARHPALNSIGLTVLLGISAAVPTAVLVIPAFRPRCSDA